MEMLARLVTLLQNSFGTIPNVDKGLGPIGDDFKTGFEDCHKTHKHQPVVPDLVKGSSPFPKNFKSPEVSYRTPFDTLF